MLISESAQLMHQPFRVGLSNTYDIVTKAHGGMIAVDSKVDEFSEFVLTLPRNMFAREESRA